MATEQQQIVRLRDDFYRDGFYRVLIAIGTIVVTIGLLIAVSVYLVLSKPKPVEFVTDDEWRVLAPVPLEKPYLKTADLIQWVSNVIPNAFVYDFINYTQQLKNETQYFTTNGWKKFLDQLNIYVNYNNVQNSKLFVNATADGAPIIVNQGLLQGRYSWWVQMPISITYSSDQKVSAQTITVQVLVVRVPTTNNLDGVGIENFIVLKPAEATGDQVSTNE